MGRQFGFVPIFLSEVRLPKDKREAIKAGVRSELTLLLLHEIPIWPAWSMDLPTVIKIHQVKGEFGYGEEDVIFHPYWEKEKVVMTDSEDVKVSLWKRPEKMLAVVANLGEERKARIRIDFHKLNLSPQEIKDYESEETLLLKDGWLNLDLPRHDFRLIWIK